MKQQQNLIVINGRTYDTRTGMIVQQSAPQVPLKKVFSDIAPSGPRTDLPNASLIRRNESGQIVTGKPVDATKFKTARPHVPSVKVHRTMQKTQTLRRSGLARPHLDVTARQTTGPRLTDPAMREATRQARAMATPRPAEINKYQTATPATTAQTAPVKQTPVPVRPNIALAQLQSQQLAAKPQPQHQHKISGPELKEQLINARLAGDAQSREEKLHAQQNKVNHFFSKQPRLLSAVVGTLCVLVLVGYVTYLNLPGISMRLAASRAGFAASMPNYRPSGYNLTGPVAYSPGQVSLTFRSNTNAGDFSLNQKESNWDSRALLENYVSKQTENYLTYQEKGLTIFMHEGKADWVNGGVWYSVSGPASLSSDQILKLASSM